MNRESLAIYFAGGAYGMELETKLQDGQFKSHKIDRSRSIRENIIITNDQDGAEYRFNMPISELEPSEYFKIFPILDIETDIKYLVLSGHLGDQIPKNFLQKLIDFTRANQIKVAIDSKGIGLRTAFDLGVYLIKPNRREFEMLAGEKCTDLDSLIKTGKRLLEQSPTENILISLGKEGALFIDKNESRFFSAPKIIQKNSVGAGDSLLAGIIYKLSNDLPISEAIEFGILCGAATAMRENHEFCTLEKVEWLKQHHSID